MDKLTDRERQIAALVAQGAHTPDIADRLGLSPQTVKNALTQTYRVLHLGAGIDRRVALAIMWEREGHDGRA